MQRGIDRKELRVRTDEPFPEPGEAGRERRRHARDELTFRLGWNDRGPIAQAAGFPRRWLIAPAVSAREHRLAEGILDLHRFCSGLLRAILAIKETGYGSNTQR